jgi:hypothetical protein
MLKKKKQEQQASYRFTQVESAALTQMQCTTAAQALLWQQLLPTSVWEGGRQNFQASMLRLLQQRRWLLQQCRWLAARSWSFSSRRLSRHRVSPLT